MEPSFRLIGRRVLCCLVYPIYCLLFVGCSGEAIRVRSDYIDSSYLASSHVDAPDPRRCTSFCGQQLIIQWNFCRRDWRLPSLKLLLTVRLRNNEERTVEIPMRFRFGMATYRVMNEEYFRTCGILTYQLRLLSGDQVVQTWSHQIWTRLIDLSEKTDSDSLAPWPEEEE